MLEALLGLGSNLGDPQAKLKETVKRLGGECRVEQVSPLYRTEPVGYAEQDWFLNCVLRVKTDLKPSRLLQQIAEIEAELGRERVIPHGPRTIDIDILLIDDLVLNQSDLIVPHPRMHLRRFVLAPANDVAAEWVHPILRQTLGALLEELHDDARVELYSQDSTGWRSQA